MSQEPDDLIEAAKRAEAVLESLNARIARLSLVLGVSLDSEEEFEQILNRTTPFFQQHPPHQSGASLSSQEHRLVREWEELRGLLVLRCDMMTNTLNELGLETTLKITTHVETHLAREGFNPGADGFDLFKSPKSS